MNIDSLNASQSQYVYIWVRPANGASWYEFNGNSSFGQVNENDWRPAMVSGFVDADDRSAYNTGRDPRRVQLVGSQYGYDIHQFEFGELIASPDATLDEEPVMRMFSI